MGGIGGSGGGDLMLSRSFDGGLTWEHRTNPLAVAGYMRDFAKTGAGFKTSGTEFSNGYYRPDIHFVGDRLGVWAAVRIGVNHYMAYMESFWSERDTLERCSFELIPFPDPGTNDSLVTTFEYAELDGSNRVRVRVMDSCLQQSILYDTIYFSGSSTEDMFIDTIAIGFTTKDAAGNSNNNEIMWSWLYGPDTTRSLGAAPAPNAGYHKPWVSFATDTSNSNWSRLAEVVPGNDSLFAEAGSNWVLRLYLSFDNNDEFVKITYVQAIGHKRWYGRRDDWE